MIATYYKIKPTVG